jgi:hypothetical protein
MVLGFMRPIEFQVQVRASLKPLFEAIPNPSSRPILRFRFLKKILKLPILSIKRQETKAKWGACLALCKLILRNCYFQAIFLAFILFGMVVQGLVSIAVVEE